MCPNLWSLVVGNIILGLNYKKYKYIYKLYNLEKELATKSIANVYTIQ